MKESSCRNLSPMLFQRMTVESWSLLHGNFGWKWWWLGSEWGSEADGSVDYSRAQQSPCGPFAAWQTWLGQLERTGYRKQAKHPIRWLESTAYPPHVGMPHSLIHAHSQWVHWGETEAVYQPRSINWVVHFMSFILTHHPYTLSHNPSRTLSSYKCEVTKPRFAWLLPGFDFTGAMLLFNESMDIKL